MRVTHGYDVVSGESADVGGQAGRVRTGARSRDGRAVEREADKVVACQKFKRECLKVDKMERVVPFRRQGVSG